jgi:corin
MQQQSQVPANKQQQVGTRKIEEPQCHTNQSASFQTQIQPTLNQSQMQQGLTQTQNHIKQPPQTLKQNQTQQLSNKPQGQNSQLCNKQQTFPTPQPQPKTQEAQTQQQPAVVPLSRVEQQPYNNKVSVRQDSNVSNDSFSQNSSPSYTTKTMETPLLPSHGVISTSASQKASSGGKKKMLNGDVGNGAPLTGNDVSSNGNAALTKSMSTPASLQTIVRFHHGSNMSLHHRVSMTPDTDRRV